MRQYVQLCYTAANEFLMIGIQVIHVSFYQKVIHVREN